MENQPQEGMFVQLDKEELHILVNALNEVLHGISDRTLPTRMGASREEIQALFTRLKASHVE